jgi:hypothetical protein
MQLVTCLPNFCAQQALAEEVDAAHVAAGGNHFLIGTSTNVLCKYIRNQVLYTLVLCKYFHPETGFVFFFRDRVSTDKNKISIQ